VLYLVLFDISLESECVTLAFNQKKLKVLLRNLENCLVLKWKKKALDIIKAQYNGCEYPGSAGNPGEIQVLGQF
jgi:hypothetical protein